MYLSIETGYVWGSGHTDEQNITFRELIKTLAKHINLNVCEPDRSAPIMYSQNLKQIVYCHPMELTGEVDKNTESMIETFMTTHGISSKRITVSEQKSYDWLRNSLRREIDIK